MKTESRRLIGTDRAAASIVRLDCGEREAEGGNEDT